MYRFVLHTSALLLLLLAGFITPVQAEERPFRADLSGYLPSGGSMFANGKATHLGQAGFYGNADQGAFDASQKVYITALLFAANGNSANGDQLYLNIVMDFNEPTRIGIGTLTFTGGTGRFEDATGSADVMFAFDSSFQQFLFLIDGSIDY